jgi:hypothetical protein
MTKEQLYRVYMMLKAVDTTSDFISKIPTADSDAQNEFLLAISMATLMEAMMLIYTNGAQMNTDIAALEKLLKEFK